MHNNWSGYGAITVAGGLASGVVSPVITLTTANVSGSNPLTTGWTAETPNLIHGLSPSTATGNLLQPTGSGGASVLTDGSIGVSGTQSGFVSCGGGVGGNAACTTLIYALTNVVNGTDVTNIVVYSGWGDTGRFGQYYLLSYATLANPTTFIPITTVYYWPGLLNGGGSAEACRVAIANNDGSPLASGVKFLKFEFQAPVNSSGNTFNNGWQGYSEIIVQGQDTVRQRRRRRRS